MDTAESRAPGAVRSGFAIYLDRRLVAIFAMGFASGLPFLLSGSTLSYWLAKRGVDKTSIGLFAAAGLPYALKFLWAPALDFVRVPILDARFGRRRAWMLVAQAALAASILALGTVDPAHAPFATGVLAMLVAFCSATQDVAIDAYRIEILRESEQAAGAAATQTGYRLGLLAAGAGAIALADYVAWPVVFRILAALVGVGALAVVLAPRAPEGEPGMRIDFVTAFVAPIRDLALRRAIGAIVAFALLYKFGDAVLGAMANPFYVELGFSGAEVASVTKVFGLAANVAGVLVGGAVVARIGIWRALAIGGVLQALAHLLFTVQAHVGHDLGMLAVAVGGDALAGGFAGSAFVAYLSSLCRTGMSATQYAVLTSLMAVGRTLLATGSGWLASELGWPLFFVATTILAVPGLLLLWYLWWRTETEPDRRGLLLG